jgi:RNA ligase (TIGR02306 family)
MKTLTKRLSKNPSEKNILGERITEISTLNTRPEFEFLRQKKFIAKTAKIRGVVSQGIIFPIDILKNVGVDLNTFELQDGMDLTDLLGITQYIEPEPANLGGDTKGSFPINQLSSDEERLENLNEEYSTLKQYRYVVTEKLEGSSGTFFLSNNEFGVCSRSLNLKESETNTFWKIARKLNIEESMRKYAEQHGLVNFNIQGEVVGEGIQSNIYKLKGQTVRLYAGFNIDTQTYFEYEQFLEMVKEMGLETCPVISTDYELPENPDQLFELVDNFKTTFGNTVGKFFAEGWVFVAKNVRPYETITRSGFGRLSFKAKSRTYEYGKY